MVLIGGIFGAISQLVGMSILIISSLILTLWSIYEVDEYINRRCKLKELRNKKNKILEIMKSYK